jgi:hypothetical protein
MVQHNQLQEQKNKSVNIVRKIGNFSKLLQILEKITGKENGGGEGCWSVTRLVGTQVFQAIVKFGNLNQLQKLK